MSSISCSTSSNKKREDLDYREQKKLLRCHSSMSKSAPYSQYSALLFVFLFSIQAKKNHNGEYPQCTVISQCPNDAGRGNGDGEHGTISDMERLLAVLRMRQNPSAPSYRSSGFHCNSVRAHAQTTDSNNFVDIGFKLID